MTKYLYALKNRLSGIYENPTCEKYDEKEYPELLAQSLAVAPVEMLELHKEFDLYRVGTFDTKSGECQVDAPEFIMSLEGLCLQYLAVKVKSNVGRESDRNEAEVNL